MLSKLKHDNWLRFICVFGLMSLIEIWPFKGGLSSSQGQEWTKHSNKFISFRAPHKAQVTPFPDPLPKEASLHAFFMVNLPFENKDIKLVRISISCLRKGSSMMRGLSPDKFFSKMRSEIFKGQKIIQRKDIVLIQQKLKGEIKVLEGGLKQVWHVLAYNSDFFLSVIWGAPVSKSKEVELLVMSILNTFEFIAEKKEPSASPSLPPPIDLLPRNWVASIAFSPDRTFLASGSIEGTIQFWRVKDGSLMWLQKAHAGSVPCVAFSPDGRLLASGSADGTLKLWQVKDCALVRTLKEHKLSVTSIAFSPDGILLASGSGDRTIKLWRVKDGTLIRNLEHTGWVDSVTFSPEGSLLASGDHDGIIKLWRVKDGALIWSLKAHAEWVLSIAFSPDGTNLASGSQDGTIKLWRVKDGALVRTLKHKEWIESIAFAQDGTLLIGGSANKTVKLWQVKKDDVVMKILKGHTASVSCVAFSRDGNLLASGDNDGTIKVWRVKDGILMKTLKGQGVGK